MRIRTILASLKSCVSWKHLLVFVSAIVAIIWTTFLQESTKQFLTWLFSTSPRVSYRVVSIERLVKHGLMQYANRELREAFNLQLDDPIIKRYDVFKLRIKNEGSAITGGFKLQAQVNQGEAKIVEIKHVVRFPVNKAIMIDYSLPNFTWRPLKAKSKVAFNLASRSDTGIPGHYLYKSALKDVGYGKFNIGLIRKSCLVLDEEELPQPGYYAAVAVGLNGIMSDLSRPVKFPESVALQPRFKDVITIDPNFDRHNDCLVSEERIYHSLSEALAKEGRKATFLIRQRRADIQSSVEQLNEYSRDLRIFYEDDLGFLRGQIELSFPAGLDAEGEIDFYFVTKNSLDSEPNISLVFIGQPTVSFIRRPGDNEARHGGAANSMTRKLALTPKLVTARTSNKTISLVWAPNQGFKGIRVFRSATVQDKENKRIDSLGEEIYDGKYLTGKFECQAKKSNQGVTPVEIKLSGEIINPPPDDPPKRKHEIKEGIPAAPLITLSFTGGIEEPVSFFTDSDVREGLRYTYTIYIFDNDGNYSYPVQINASLNDSPSDLVCNLVEEDKKK